MLKKFFNLLGMTLLAVSLTANAAYQALIFDCDGVLVDTEQLKFQAWRQALQPIGIDFQEADYLHLVGFDSAYIAKAISLQKQTSFDQKAIISNKQHIYHQLQKQGVVALPDAVTFLKLAIAKKHALNLKIAIASSASKKEILENLKQLHINPHDLDHIISGSDDLHHIHDSEGVNKPKPYIYQICAQALNVSPKLCLVFEDSHAGVVAAAHAGMKVIAIPNRYTRHQDFSMAMKIATFNDIDLFAIQAPI